MQLAACALHSGGHGSAPTRDRSISTWGCRVAVLWGQMRNRLAVQRAEMARNQWHRFGQFEQLAFDAKVRKISIGLVKGVD